MNCYVNDFTPTVKKYYKNIKNCNPITKEEEKILMKKAKNNDIAARDKILSSNLKFVFDVAKKYKGFGVPMEDLISEGNMGLIHAFDKFDESKDVKFISYAVWWIKFYIKDFVEKRNAESEHEISDDDLMSSTIKTKGLDDFEDEVLKTSDVIMSNEGDSSQKDVFFENKELIKYLLRKLDIRERKIIECYFGLNGKKPMTLEECGKVLSLSNERIRQIKTKSLLKLRSEMLLLS